MCKLIPKNRFNEGEKKGMTQEQFKSSHTYERQWKGWGIIDNATLIPQHFQHPQMFSSPLLDLIFLTTLKGEANIPTEQTKKLRFQDKMLHEFVQGNTQPQVWLPLARQIYKLAHLCLQCENGGTGPRPGSHLDLSTGTLTLLPCSCPPLFLLSPLSQIGTMAMLIQCKDSLSLTATYPHKPPGLSMPPNKK